MAPAIGMPNTANLRVKLRRKHLRLAEKLSYKPVDSTTRQSSAAAPAPRPTAFLGRARGTAAAANTSQIKLLTDFDVSTGPRLQVRGNNAVIGNLDSTPSSTDHTDFGRINSASGFIDRSYAIHNIGALLMRLGALSVSGALAMVLNAMQCHNQG